MKIGVQSFQRSIFKYFQIGRVSLYLEHLIPGLGTAYGYRGSRESDGGAMQGSGHLGIREPGLQSVFQLERRMVFLNKNIPASMTVTLLLLLLSRTEGRPLPVEDKLELKLVQSQKTIGGGDTVGGGLDTLISDMFNRIIQRRLENLLQGLTTPNKKELHLLESSESLSSEEINKNSAFEEEFLEVNLPFAVTEIPPDVFTGLPGRLLVLFSQLIFIDSSDNVK